VEVGQVFCGTFQLLLPTRFPFETTQEDECIGSSTKRERVEKLWNGLRPELQQALWRENLEPQHSTWEQVLRVAERHEIADQIFLNDRRSIGDGSGGTKPGGDQDSEQQLPDGTLSPSDSESLGYDLDKHMSSDSRARKMNCEQKEGVSAAKKKATSR
jgi:hypothetical protein